MLTRNRHVGFYFFSRPTIGLLDELKLEIIHSDRPGGEDLRSRRFRAERMVRRPSRVPSGRNRQDDFL